MGKFEAPKSRNNKKRRLWILAAVEVFVLLALVVGLVALLNRNPLQGNWYDQGRLTYKFGSNGKGVLVLEDGLARFSYEIKGDTLIIDFQRRDIPDETYQFSVEKDSLILDNGSATAPQTYSRG